MCLPPLSCFSQKVPDFPREGSTALICTSCLETCKQQAMAALSGHQTFGETLFKMCRVRRWVNSENAETGGRGEGIMRREYGRFSLPPCVCVEIRLPLIVFRPQKMRRRLKMTVIHLRLSCKDRYVKQMAGNIKDNFAPNVRDWASVTVSMKRLIQ